MTIWITRGSGLSLQFRGLGHVRVWFHEPCLKIHQRYSNPNNPFDETEEEERIRKELYGILYTRNGIYNFVFRKENDVNSEFGNKLIRNHDGIDIPESLYTKYKEHLLFEFEVFGSGEKTSYRPNVLPNLFGYESDIAEEAWRLVCEDFDNKPFDTWDKLEKEKPWWRFCKKIEIDIKLWENQ